MKINTDLIIKPGKQEKYNIFNQKKIKVCEDYIVKSGENQIPMIVISDGCSSQDFSDWGSRILSLEYFNFFQKYLNEMYKRFIFNINVDFNITIFYKAKDKIKQFNFDERILNATISFCFIDEIKKDVYVNILNDGYLIVGYKNGEIEVNKFEYLKNAPFYLPYRFNEDLKNRYLREFPENKLLHIQSLYDKKNNFQIKYCYYREHDIKFYFFQKYMIDNIEFVLITTDGINTFHGENDKFIKELIDFKSLNGEFIQRRTNKIFRDFEKENIYHLDDITIGGFSFIEE